MKFWIQIIFTVTFLAHGTFGDIPLPVNKYIDQASRIGETRVNVFIWDLYDISLFAESEQFDPERPFALHLKYLREIKGQIIAEKSIEEMRRQGIGEYKLAAWFTQLKEFFPDVNQGTELTGIFIPGQATRFYKGDQFLGQVMDPEFGRPFSDIWLGSNSSIPKIRTELIDGSVR